jgi:hypothetical protein
LQEKSFFKGGKKMKKKIVGILFCMILITISSPLTGGIMNKLNNTSINDFNQDNNDNLDIDMLNPTKLEQEVDQSQEQCQECKFFENYAWQQFVPQGKKLLTIDICISQWYSDSPDLTITIEKPLGTILSSATIEAKSVPNIDCDWVSIDVNPDITLQKEQIYYIVLSYEPGGEYGWCGAEGNLYEPGESSIGSNWDFCFRTIVSKQRSIDSINIFKNFPILFQFLHKIINNIKNLVQILNY